MRRGNRRGGKEEEKRKGEGRKEDERWRKL